MYILLLSTIVFSMENSEKRRVMRRILPAVVALVCLAPALSAQQVYRIYDGPAPGSENANYGERTITIKGSETVMTYNISVPTITVYRPDKAIDTGAAMIIAPGGGNIFLTMDEEGHNVAQWFQRNGITGIVLKYRTTYLGETEEDFYAGVRKLLEYLANAEKRKEKTAPTEPQRSMQGDDGRQAIRYVRKHAGEWGINPDKIGLMGFSAGSFLTLDVIEYHDTESCPNLVAPIYGYRDILMPEDTVPIFFCAPQVDYGNVEGAIGLFSKYQERQLPAELHFIYDATHGDGLKYNGKEWNEWIDMLHNYMKAVKFIH